MMGAYETDIMCLEIAIKVSLDVISQNGNTFHDINKRV